LDLEKIFETEKSGIVASKKIRTGKFKYELYYKYREKIIRNILFSRLILLLTIQCTPLINEDIVNVF
jgi:hypothetical protein